MTPKEILIAARAKIADPKNWTKHTAARDKKEAPVPARESTAVCWCAIGAMRAVTADEDNKEFFARVDARELLEKAIGDDLGIADYNDTHTHAEVLAKFDEAINAA